MAFAFKKNYLPIKREIRCSLQAIKGIGWHKSIWIASKLGCKYPLRFRKINKSKRLRARLEVILSKCTWLTTRLNRVVNTQIRDFITLNCYRGFRHKANLPVRGQRTRTNANTQKRKRKRVKFIN